MNRFAIAQPKDFRQAREVLNDKGYSLPVLKAGGMDLLDHLKEGLLEPDLLINVKTLGRDNVRPVIRLESLDGTTEEIHIEAMTTLAEIAASPVLKKNAPVLAQAAGDAASPQVRNVATAAGNLLQRPRCWYYRHAQFDCLKKGGFHCYAVEGENKFHAVFGDGPCYIVHPSNLAVAMSVLGGAVYVMGVTAHTVSMADLFHTPDDAPDSEHTLKSDEVVLRLTAYCNPTSGFYAIKEKQSFDWPLVMAAAALTLDGSTIASARVCAGAVAPIPWPLPAVERALKGVNVDDEAALTRACAHAVEGAKPLSDNAYKLTLLPVAVRRAILRAAGRKVED